MDIISQIERGLLVCPKSKKKLVLMSGDNYLVTEDGSHRYDMVDGLVPNFLGDSQLFRETESTERVKNFKKNPGAIMQSRYKYRAISWLKSIFFQDHRTKSSENGMKSIFQGLTERNLCISVGGGPTRANELFTNLNIAYHTNVDVVGDAHELPYREESVDALHCEAVLEHLADPKRAVEEMYRVMKKSRRVFICTPFMQAYHGDPYHFQNFTLTGQRYMLQSCGFKILDSGTCVGPTYAMTKLISIYFMQYFPYPINKMLWVISNTVSLLLRPIDRILAKNENTHKLASTTYVVAEK